MKIQTDVLELINTIINVINTMIILIPAIALYLYHKLHIVNIYVLEKTNAGIIIGIHNITSKTLIFSECNIIVNKKTQYSQTINLYEINDEKFINIKSDDIFKIKVDYNLMNIKMLKSIKIELIRKHRKIKRKLV